MSRAAHFARIGMIAVIRDLQEWLAQHTQTGEDVDVTRLRAYLLGQLILAGGYDDGQG